MVYPEHTAVVYGTRRFTWRQTRDRCLRLASALSRRLGIARGDVVAVLAPNVPAIYELHFGAAMAGAVLCTLNTRHDSNTVANILGHSEAKVIFVDEQLLQILQGAVNILTQKHQWKSPFIVNISDSCELHNTPNSVTSFMEYENLLEDAQLPFKIIWPVDECDPISLNYTSGTTSSPKGVIYSHRGAYLNAIATVLFNDMTTMPVYLWTVPMFHCNGWCLPWGLAAQGGTNICLRQVSAKAIFDNIATHKVSFMGGAPTVLNMIVNAPIYERKPLPGRVTVMTGGAPPPAPVLFKMEELGFHVIHSYGLTETYGPATICTWFPEWDSLPPLERAKLKARQGMQHLGMDDVDVKDPVTMESVPADGKTMGEVMFRGNTVMNGYFKDIKATREALAGGWFHSGDLAVKHADGYIQLKDRSKDIIISGGENISTIEVESVIFSHPAILEAAVVGRPDDYWGETPCAFVKLKEGVHATAADIIQFCRSRLPHYMAPRSVVFDDLPKTSTGKIQKFILKEKAKSLGSLPKTVKSKL